jgi:hypothetical protein
LRPALRASAARKAGILKIATEGIHFGDPIEVADEPENVQDSGIGADGDAGSAFLETPQRHQRHPGPFSDQLGG